MPFLSMKRGLVVDSSDIQQSNIEAFRAIQKPFMV